MEENTLTGEAVASESMQSTEAKTTEITTTNETSDKSILENALNGDETKANQEVKTDSKEAEKEIEYAEFKLPDGLVLDPNVADEFKKTAKDLKLSQEQAQALVDIQSKHVQEMNTKIQHDFKNQVNAWKEETIKELGPSLKEDQAYIAKVVKQFGTPELTNLLNQTGLGNNKDVVKFLINVGKNYSDDKFVDGKKSEGTKDAAKSLYPNMN
jgi:hypothetical protein